MTESSHAMERLGLDSPARKDEDDEYAQVLSVIVTASALADDSYQKTTLALACWSLSTAAGAQRVQEDEISAYCRRLLRTLLPTPLLHVFLGAFATGLARSLQSGTAPLPTRSCVLFLTEIACVASRLNDAALLAMLLEYFAKFDLSKQAESQQLSSALVISAIMLSPGH